MPIDNDRYRCAYCGALLDIPLWNDPQVTTRTAKGRANLRAVFVDGKEIVHSCEIGEATASTTRSRWRVGRR